MKLAESYAHALYDLSEGGSVSIDQFISFLKAKGHIKLLPSVLNALERVIESKRDTDTLTFTVARESDFEKFKAELKEHFEHANAEFTREVVDDTIIGGYILEKGQTVIDASYKKKLLEIYQAATI